MFRRLHKLQCNFEGSFFNPKRADDTLKQSYKKKTFCVSNWTVEIIKESIVSKDKEEQRAKEDIS